ncbi:MAG: DJ-1/PfpI family protein [Saprospiraceae bacterium]|nr:DJ-1/PfpI family protein [Saprospiraceae bacterium]
MKKKPVLLFALLIMAWNGMAQLKEPRNVLLFLYENVEILDFAGPMEVFMQAGFNVYTVAPDKEIRAMNKLRITPDYILDDPNIPQADILALPGGDGAFACIENPKIVEWIKTISAGTQLNFSVCTGAYLLAEAELLNDKKATTFHTLLDDMQQRYPKVNVLKQVRFVDNGKEVTTAGISAGIDGALYLISRVLGKQRAIQVAQNMEYDKWKPDSEGLILNRDSFNEIKAKGFAKAVSEGKTLPFYKGELLALAEYYTQQNDYTEAAQYYEFIIKSYTATAGDYNELAKFYKKQGKDAPPTWEEFLAIIKDKGVAKAEEAWLEVKRKRPDWIIFSRWGLYMNAYHEYFEKGDTEKAIQIMELVIKAYPDFPNAYFQLGEYYTKLNNKNKALENYKKAKSLAPDNEEFAKKVAELEK